MSSQLLLQSSSSLTQYLGMARMSGISIWRMYLGMVRMSGISISSSITSKQGFSPSSSRQLSPSFSISTTSLHKQSSSLPLATKWIQSKRQAQLQKPSNWWFHPCNYRPQFRISTMPLSPQKMLFCHCHFEGRLDRSPDGTNTYEGGKVEGFGVNDTMDYKSFMSEVCERLEITDRIGLTIKYSVGNGKRPPSTMRNEGDYKTFFHFNKDEADIFVFKNDRKRPFEEGPSANYAEHHNKRHRHPSAWP